MTCACTCPHIPDYNALSITLGILNIDGLFTHALVIDHGISSVELVMEEAVQDIPPLAHDIQERLKGLSESVAVDGKPRPGLPTRRMLWDTLKPQASAVRDVHVCVTKLI